MQDKCCIEGCDIVIAVKKHQLCRPHYARYVRKGLVDIDKNPINHKGKHKPFKEAFKQNKSK